VLLDDGLQESRAYDDVVIATHADQALQMLSDASGKERQLLGAFRYNKNRALLHKDPQCMPHLRNVWSSWNYFSKTIGDAKQLSVTYWMNSLQHIPECRPRFVTLNPLREPELSNHIHEDHYEHPFFDAKAILAQRELWFLQGQRNTWFCGAHFGAGFHEDGLQAGLAVAEALGGLRRPWQVEAESGRIVLSPAHLAGLRT
jgi:predicted NAD/FAD-binding protein